MSKPKTITQTLRMSKEMLAFYKLIAKRSGVPLEHVLLVVLTLEVMKK